MRDDFRNIQPEESVRINLSQPHEITYWTCRLNITESELKKAIEKAGPGAKGRGRARQADVGGSDR